MILNWEMFPLRLNGKTIKRVFEFRYLGVIIDTNLTFKAHLTTVTTARMNSATYKLQTVKIHVSEYVMGILFNAYVLSIYDYCIEVWCVHSLVELNILQSKVYRFLFSYINPTLSRKYKKSPRSMALHSIHGQNMHSLLRFNLLSIHDRMIWTILKNEYGYRHTIIPGLKSMFAFSSNTRSTRSMPLVDS